MHPSLSIQMSNHIFIMPQGRPHASPQMASPVVNLQPTQAQQLLATQVVLQQTQNLHEEGQDGRVPVEEGEDEEGQDGAIPADDQEGGQDPPAEGVHVPENPEDFFREKADIMKRWETVKSIKNILSNTGKIQSGRNMLIGELTAAVREQTDVLFDIHRVLQHSFSTIPGAPIRGGLVEGPGLVPPLVASKQEVR